MGGVSSVLEDPTFEIPSGPAASSRKLAEYLTSWIPKHRDIAATFEAKMVSLLTSCMNRQHRTQKVQREKMWSAYHSLRVSEKYLSEWNTFFSESGSSMSHIFCQHVGHHMFKTLIKKHNPIPETASPKERSFNPTYEELNGMRYAAGWVARALKNKLKKSFHPLKNELTLCLNDL